MVLSNRYFIKEGDDKIILYENGKYWGKCKLAQLPKTEDNEDILYNIMNVLNRKETKILTQEQEILDLYRQLNKNISMHNKYRIKIEDDNTDSGEKIYGNPLSRYG